MGEKLIGPALDAEYAGLVLPINRVDVEMPWGWLRRGWQDMAQVPQVSPPYMTTGSPVSRMLLQPYCGAVGVSQGSTRLLTNGSSAHSEISWLSA